MLHRAVFWLGSSKNEAHCQEKPSSTTPDEKAKPVCNDVGMLLCGCFKLASSPICARGPFFILVVSPLPVRGRAGHTPTPPPSVQQALGGLENPAAGESTCICSTR